MAQFQYDAMATRPFHDRRPVGGDRGHLHRRYYPVPERSRGDSRFFAAAEYRRADVVLDAVAGIGQTARCRHPYIVYTGWLSRKQADRRPVQ